jgi:hypothetical protein
MFILHTTWVVSAHDYTKRAMCRCMAINIIGMTTYTDFLEVRNILTGAYWSTFSIAMIYQRYINYTKKLILFLTGNWSRECVVILVTWLLAG